MLMKALASLGWIILAGLVLLSLANVNVIRSAVDTISSDKPTLETGEIVSGLMETIQNNIIIPLWLLLMVILIILVVK